MSGRKRYKLEKETYLQMEGNTTFATSSSVFFNTDYQGHLHLFASLLGLMHKSAPSCCPFASIHLLRALLFPSWGLLRANTNTNLALRIITIINTKGKKQEKMY